MYFQLSGDRRNWNLYQLKNITWYDESGSSLKKGNCKLCVGHYPGETMVPGYFVDEEAGAGGSVIVWTRFCWETLASVIHVYI